MFLYRLQAKELKLSLKKVGLNKVYSLAILFIILFSDLKKMTSKNPAH